MITFARIIEAWRDAEAFEFPTAPRSKLWHVLKYPQFGLWLSSALTYFLIFQFGLETWDWWVGYLGMALAVAAGDVGVAALLFDPVLEYFRERMRPERPRVEW